MKDDIAKLKTELDQERDKAARLADHSRSVISKNEALHVSKSDMELKIKDLEEKDESAQIDIATFKRQVCFLKRKRKDNIAPASHTSPTKILARPPSPKVATASQASTSPARSDSLSLLQPAAKKSRSRKARWDNAPAISPCNNVSGKGKYPLEEKAKPVKKAVERDSPTFEEQDTLDPVLCHSFTSFRTKHDINAEIDTWDGIGIRCSIVILSQIKSQSQGRHWRTQRSSSRTAAATPQLELQEATTVATRR